MSSENATVESEKYVNPVDRLKFAYIRANLRYPQSSRAAPYLSLVVLEMMQEDLRADSIESFYAQVDPKEIHDIKNRVHESHSREAIVGNYAQVEDVIGFFWDYAKESIEEIHQIIYPEDEVSFFDPGFARTLIPEDRTERLALFEQVFIAACEVLDSDPMSDVLDEYRARINDAMQGSSDKGSVSSRLMRRTLKAGEYSPAQAFRKKLKRLGLKGKKLKKTVEVLFPSNIFDAQN